MSIDTHDHQQGVRRRRRVRTSEVNGAASPALLDIAMRPVLILAFLISSGAFLLQFSGIDPSQPLKTQDASSATSQIALGISYLIPIGYALLDWRNFIRMLAKCWPLFLMPAMAVISMLWSPAPDTTLRRSLALVGCVLSVVALVSRLPKYTALSFLLQALTAALVLSVLYIVAVPKFGLHQLSDAMQNAHAGQWRGIFSHRTGLGRTAGLAIPLLLYAGARALGNRYFAWAGMAVGGLCMIMSKSGGAFVTAGLLTALPFLVLQYQRFEKNLRPMVVVAFFAVVTAFEFVLDVIVPIILGALGKDVTLTGRTPIWSFVLYELQSSPFIGFSYSAGWWYKVSQDLKTKTIYGLVPNAQNGYIDTAVSVGVIGLILALIPVVIAFVRSLRLATSPSPGINMLAIAPFMVMVFYFESNTVEAWLFASNSIGTQVFVLVYAALARNDLFLTRGGDSRRTRSSRKRSSVDRTVPKEAPAPVLEL